MMFPSGPTQLNVAELETIILSIVTTQSKFNDSLKVTDPFCSMVILKDGTKDMKNTCTIRNFMIILTYHIQCNTIISHYWWTSIDHNLTQVLSTIISSTQMRDSISISIH